MNFSIPVHRLILSAASDYLSTILHIKAEDRELIKSHEIPDTDGAYLKMIVDFCYTGIVVLTESNVYRLLDIAKPLQLIDLIIDCGKFLKNNLRDENCINVWTLAETFEPLKDVAEAAFKHAETNFFEVPDTNGFLALDTEHMKTLLNSDDLEVYSEEEVFDALLKWVNFNHEARKYDVAGLLASIRLNQLTPQVCIYINNN